jgi:hypothetical protein
MGNFAQRTTFKNKHIPLPLTSRKARSLRAQHGSKSIQQTNDA